VVPSKYSFEFLLQQGVKVSNLVKISLGLNITNLAEWPRNTELFQVLFVGVNPLHKGIYYLLKAWNELKFKNARLIVRGPVPPKFRKLVLNPSMVAIKKRYKVEIC